MLGAEVWRIKLMKTVKALIITGFGINCEEETEAAYRYAGADTRIVHLNDILIDNFSIHNYDILTFPGGFSFGDDIASGMVLANKIRYKKLPSGKTFLEDIYKFIDDGKYILGICNGFQVLVKLGLLPNITGDRTQEVSLTLNNSGKFEDRWCYIKVNPNCKTPFLSGISTIQLPIRHGEGKLVIGNEFIEQKLIDRELVSMKYCDENGNETDAYPLNPNGSAMNCAGLCDFTGQVLGMMPHPEAYLSFYNNPNWSGIKRLSDNKSVKSFGDGLHIFENIVNYIKES